MSEGSKIIKANADRLMDEYRVAYAAFNPGEYLSVEFFRGWYTIYTGGLSQTKVRGRHLAAMTERLRYRLSGGTDDE